MSAALSRSIRRILPVARATIRTLLATCAATKSAAMLNWSCTRSTLKMGSEASFAPFRSAATYPSEPSSAIVRSQYHRSMVNKQMRTAREVFMYLGDAINLASPGSPGWLAKLRHSLHEVGAGVLKTAALLIRSNTIRSALTVGLFNHDDLYDVLPHTQRTVPSMRASKRGWMKMALRECDVPNQQDEFSGAYVQAHQASCNAP